MFWQAFALTELGKTLVHRKTNHLNVLANNDPPSGQRPEQSTHLHTRDAEWKSKDNDLWVPLDH